jgi:hypothetical protein
MKAEDLLRARRRPIQNKIFVRSIAMLFDRTPAAEYGILLQEVAARTGFSSSDMQELLECELNMDHLLEYIAAVVADRMN